MQNISTKIAMAMIDAIDRGQFFGVTFVKANCSDRKMNCRKGVKKYLKGGKTTFNGVDHNAGNIGAYDMISKGYRCFNIDRVESIRIGKREYIIKN